MALYSPELHEPLTDEAWSAESALGAIKAIVADADARYDADELWPPSDPWDDWGGAAKLPLTNLATGASGAAWGLSVLARRGHAEPRVALAMVAERAHEGWRAAPDTDEHLEPPVTTHASLMMGETGPLLVRCLLSPSAEAADALHARVVGNQQSETNELYSGSPGTMVAARAMHAATGDARWADAWRTSADVLLERREGDGFWIYPPYGKSPGASHGLASNVKILSAGDGLLGPDTLDRLRSESATALARTAVIEDGRANWEMAIGDGLVGWDGVIRTQWCHGGAGVAEAGSGFLDEDLLLAAAQLVWHAGPPNMEKGPGLCHGTGGSGFALLKVFDRTQDELWLDRARRFAMHAAGQVERWRAIRGHGRTSLWTGDIGAAMFLSACLDVDPALPIVDFV
jgi:hypothetical protein